MLTVKEWVKSKYQHIKPAAEDWLLGALILVFSAASLGFVLGQSPHQKCVEDQTELLRETTHELVPDRAGYAAENWCASNHDRPGHKKFH